MGGRCLKDKKVLSLLFFLLCTTDSSAWKTSHETIQGWLFKIAGKDFKESTRLLSNGSKELFNMMGCERKSFPFNLSRRKAVPLYHLCLQRCHMAYLGILAPTHNDQDSSGQSAAPFIHRSAYGLISPSHSHLYTVPQKMPNPSNQDCWLVQLKACVQ